MRSPTTADRVKSLMRELGKAVRSPGRIYFTGGASAVLLGWRDMTIDVDLKAEPEPLGFFESLPQLKDSLNLNIELASPDQFVPALPGWLERSRFIAQHGPLSFYHYDFYSQALSKIERDHPRDRHDVACMIRDGWVVVDRLKDLFLEIEPQLIRYPAIHAASLQQRVLAVCENGS